MKPLPWWRRAEFTRWDKWGGLVLFALIAEAGILLDGWRGMWIGFGCGAVVAVAWIETRRRLSRVDRDALP